MDWPIPDQRQGGRRATARAGRQGANSAPEAASPTKLQAGSQLLTKSSQDPGRLTSARRVAARDQSPDETYGTPGTRSRCAPRKPRGWDPEVIRRTAHLGRVHSPSTWSPELLGPGQSEPKSRPKHRPKGVCAFVEYPRT